MKALVLQHVWFEGPAHLLNALGERGYTIEIASLWNDQSLPNPEEFDFLVIMGGPMSVHDESDYPWLLREKSYIRDWLTSDKPVIGICLGAQLLAEALGAGVTRNPEKEIGWFPVQWLDFPGSPTEPDKEDTRDPVFHWHGETFDIPEGARRIAESEACVNQGFRFNSAIGLQFHLEVTPDSASVMAREGAGELFPGRFTQTAEEIVRGASLYCQQSNRLLEILLESLL